MKTKPVCITAAILCSFAGLAHAGPLDPPPGPVGSTMKPLSEVEPRIAISAANTPGTASCVYRITAPGSYYLTGNIAGQNGKACIEIAIGNVTVDLNGFTLQGAAGTLDAIRTAGGAFNNISIRNGTINGFAQDAIDLTYNGLGMGLGSVIEGVHATNNGGAGIRANRTAVIRSCSAAGNTDHGIVAADGASIESCTVRQNGSYGVFAGPTSSVMHCTAVDNATYGISASAGSTIRDCSAGENGVSGINAGDGSTIAGCSSYANAGYGVSSGTGSTIADCTVKNNVLDGIRVFYFCVVRGNNCHINGIGGGDGASIHALGSDNRIEGNHCNDSDRGIDIDSAGNFVVRNTCSNNGTNWTIAAGNYLAPIVVANQAGAVNGSSAASSLGSTDPNANFSY